MATDYRITADRNTNAKGAIELRGGNLEMLRSRDAQCVVAGGAETGKSYACCIKIHLIAQRYPGAQLAMVRKTYNSITGSIGKTFERVIKGANVEAVGGKFPTRYIYPNGSTVWVGGMDNPDRVLSSERDMIYVAQAEELTENDWETLSTRCTGRGSVAKNELGELIKPQLLGDCNPAGAKHWIKTKAAQGKLKLCNTTHKDNPTLFDAAGNITEQGKRSLAALDTLSGMRRKRLLEGIWATAEGAVYDMFDSTVHVITRPLTDFRRWYLACDEGYTNPAVLLLIGEDSDGRWHVLREFHKSGVLQATYVQQALEWFARPFINEPDERLRNIRCELAAVDEAAAGLIADMVNAGIYAIPGKGRVLDGINRVQNRLQIQGDGKPRLTFDPSCVESVNELESYVWRKTAAGISKDEPEKLHDHVPDSIRYLGDALNEPTGAWDAAAIHAGELKRPEFGSPDDLSLGGDGLELTDLQIDV